MYESLGPESQSLDIVGLTVCVCVWEGGGGGGGGGLKPHELLNQYST